MLHPDQALHYIEDHQRQLRAEADRDRLAASARSHRGGAALTTRLLLRGSDLLLAAGLWLRSRSAAQSATATPRGQWQPMPLLLLRMAQGQPRSATVFWWPVYGPSAPTLIQHTGYAVVPVAWLAPPPNALACPR